MIYDSIAPYYDFLMNHVNYGEWVNLIDFVAERYSCAKRTSILEIGGGTGSLGRQLKDRGYASYYISDISFRMLLQAQKKHLSPFCADACNLPVKNKFDLIIFLYDGINYLHSLNEYERLFLSVSACLKPAGLLLFDITTETNSLKYFKNIIDYREYEGCSIIRHSYFNRNISLQINDFILFSPTENADGLFRKESEHHEQKIFHPEEIEKKIPMDIFKIIGIFDGFSMKKYRANSERIHFLLQRNN